MQIEMISVNDLVPYEKNPRKNDQSVDKVAESIREFGFRSPVVIDRHNVVVCGHTRLKAAKKLKLQTVPCIRADDLTDEQMYMLMMHELLHVGVQEKNGEMKNGEMKYRVVPHDIEELEEILSRYGVHWAKPPDKGGGR